MDLRKRILTENECYKAGRTIEVKGLMLHSTGANNPKLSRYVDAPDLGDISPYHWNTLRPGGRQVCVHGFIGYDKDKNIATYQTLPWNHRGWGGGGSSNNTHIHVEICEANLNDSQYFKKVYQEAVELFAYLCAKFDLDPLKDIITHTEGNKMGIASNHADVMHWFPKHGKDMDDFRRDVKAELEGEAPQPERDPEANIEQLAQEVIAGKWGVGDERRRLLGDLYGEVQQRVNELLADKDDKPAPPKKSIDELAQEVIDGKHGNGDERKKSLGDRYSEVQKRVNELLAGKKDAPKSKAKSIDQLAREVIDGKHGNGHERRKSLGSNYDAVQKRVNEIVLSEQKREKSISQLADEVIRGEHGSGRERMISLGSRYTEVQKEVNRRLR
jgi:N-acetylmuramoyl-L-alanine amidase